MSFEFVKVVREIEIRIVGLLLRDSKPNPGEVIRSKRSVRFFCLFVVRNNQIVFANHRSVNSQYSLLN